MIIKKRIERLISTISTDMFEREGIVAVALLGALSGQNTFLFGPPGTAKSLISRRISSAFQEPAYFEYLMNRFSTPEDVFGPISIKALKEDKYTRKTEGYLPTAEFAFLDEIWKSSPAILNTLLTLINERIFRNGDTLEKAPLKALIAASNETPAENQGLDALYDRFIVRIMVPPIAENHHFEKLICTKPAYTEVTVPESDIIKTDEWDSWRDDIHDVELSEETIKIIHIIRKAFADMDKDHAVYVSDRRWQRAAILLKASAFFNDRLMTNHSDALLLQHCLWTSVDNRVAIEQIVKDAVRDCGFESSHNISKLDDEKESLDREIQKEIFYSDDVYDTMDIGGKALFLKATVVFKYSHRGYRGDDKRATFYIPFKEFKSKANFHPVNKQGNELETISIEFDKQGSCIIKYTERNEDYDDVVFTPKVLFHKGDKKNEVNERLIGSIAKSVVSTRSNLRSALEQVQTKLKQLQTELSSPFVTEDDCRVAVEGIHSQIDQLKLRIKDCDRLESLLK